MTSGIDVVYPYRGLIYTTHDKDGNMQFPAIVKEMVGFLHVQTPNGFAAIGTCFFVNMIDYGQMFTYIVTSKHVVKPFVDKGQVIYVRLNRMDVADVDYARILGAWNYHEDEHVDVAVALRVADDLATNPLKAAAMDIDWLVTRGRLTAPLTEGIPVFFVGLLAQYQGYKQNFPVIRQGRIALMTDEPIEGTFGLSRYYIVECQAYPGNSGSPLFIPARSRQDPTQPSLALLGIVAGFYPHEQKIYQQGGQLKLYTHTGLSLITPAEYIFEVIQMDKLKEQRKQGRGGYDLGNVQPESASNPLPSFDDPEFTEEDFEQALRKVSRRDKDS